MTVSSKLESVERKMEEKCKELSQTPRDHQTKVKEEFKELQKGREKLKKQWQVLDTKLQEGTILSPQEERRL